MTFRYPEGSEVGQGWTTPEGFAVLRLDGKGFSKFVKPFKKDDEYSPEIDAAMQSATLALLRQIDGVVAAYTVSDEISLILDLTGQRWINAWYGGRTQKLLSVPASIASAHFSLAIGKPAYFDAKMFVYSPDGLGDIREYVKKRHFSGVSNAVSSYASRHLGYRTVLDVPTGKRMEMLTEAGVEVNKNLTYGHLFLRETSISDVEFTHKRTGERVVVRNVERRSWVPRLLESIDQLLHIKPLEV